MVYGMAWWARHGILYDLAAMAWYMLAMATRHHMVHGIAWRTLYGWWASHSIMVWPGGPCIGYGVALRASHCIVWLGGHRMVWPGGHRMVYGYGPCGHGMVYGMTWRPWHGIC